MKGDDHLLILPTVKIDTQNQRRRWEKLDKMCKEKERIDKGLLSKIIRYISFVSVPLPIFGLGFKQ